jgi:hypothetical protein
MGETHENYFVHGVHMGAVLSKFKECCEDREYEGSLEPIDETPEHDYLTDSSSDNDTEVCEI